METIYNNGRHITPQQTAATEGTHYRVEPHDARCFALYDTRDNSLVAVFAYLKGAAYVAKRFGELEKALVRSTAICRDGAAA